MHLLSLIWTNEYKNKAKLTLLYTSKYRHCYLLLLVLVEPVRYSNPFATGALYSPSKLGPPDWLHQKAIPLLHSRLNFGKSSFNQGLWNQALKCFLFYPKTDSIWFLQYIFRETTLFPNIHGLNALLPLLFAPVAEIR